jgi:endoglucanase
MATSEGLFVVTNMHHGIVSQYRFNERETDRVFTDSWVWADVTQPTNNITMIQEKFHASWLQIGATLACKSSLVAFEPINEPPANTATDGALINEFNSLFLDALAQSGGFNSQRVVTLVGGSMDATKTTEWFVAPSGITNPWALQYHYYTPC